MSILIKGMEMPKDGRLTLQISADGSVYVVNHCNITAETYTTEAVPIPKHGKLIDADVLRQTMYHEAFETDSPMQKWDSGCWIRYKMFERLVENAPTIIPADDPKEE